MPKRKTSIGPQPLDCSDGAKMLIDQMKEHPEEFKGYAGKFTAILDMAREATQGAHRNVKMSERDANAIMAAAEEHLYEVWLAEDVLTSIMQPKPEVEQAWGTTTGRSGGKSSVLGQLQGGTISNSIYSNGNIGASNVTTSQYIEQVYRSEVDRYKMELEKHEREDFERREREHAMRITKPFKHSI